MQEPVGPASPHPRRRDRRILVRLGPWARTRTSPYAVSATRVCGNPNLRAVGFVTIIPAERAVTLREDHRERLLTMKGRTAAIVSAMAVGAPHPIGGAAFMGVAMPPRREAFHKP